MHSEWLCVQIFRIKSQGLQYLVALRTRLLDDYLAACFVRNPPIRQAGQSQFFGSLPKIFFFDWDTILTFSPTWDSLREFVERLWKRSENLTRKLRDITSTLHTDLVPVCSPVFFLEDFRWCNWRSVATLEHCVSQAPLSRASLRLTKRITAQSRLLDIHIPQDSHFGTSLNTIESICQFVCRGFPLCSTWNVYHRLSIWYIFDLSWSVWNAPFR